MLGGAEDEPLPWIVAFHGLGDTPENFAHVFDNVRLRAHVYLARAPIAYGSGYDWLGARVADDAKLTQGIQARLPDIAALLDTLAELQPNTGDAVVTGFSQGGILSFAIAAAGLKHVKAAVPIAGWLPAALASEPTSVPLIAFHGEADSVVPFGPTQALISIWKARSQDANLIALRSYPTVQHTISPAMHNDWAEALRTTISAANP